MFFRSNCMQKEPPFLKNHMQKNRELSLCAFLFSKPKLNWLCIHYLYVHTHTHAHTHTHIQLPRKNQNIKTNHRKRANPAARTRSVGDANLKKNCTNEHKNYGLRNFFLSRPHTNTNTHLRSRSHTRSYPRSRSRSRSRPRSCSRSRSRSRSHTKNYTSKKWRYPTGSKPRQQPAQAANSLTHKELKKILKKKRY